MKKFVKIYGERNTSTNYLSRIIELNLDVQQIPGLVPPWLMHLENILPGKETIRDLYFQITYRFNLGWKHTRVKPLAELKKYRIRKHDPCFVTITKNPYSWLLSLYRNPYHQYFDTQPDFETFVRTPWQTVSRENCPPCLNSPVELWNLKNWAYLPLIEFGGLNFTTEHILENPATVIDTISSRFGLARTNAAFVNLNRSTKERDKDISYYRDYYLNEKWRRLLSRNALTTINSFLDRELMNHFGYAVLSPDEAKPHN